MDITLQLAAAFGQGAGTMLIEAGALRPAYDAYATHIARAVPYWEDRRAHQHLGDARDGRLRGPPGPVGRAGS